MNAEQVINSYPLSPMQLGMLFHAVSAREPGVDIEQVICTLNEPLDVSAFERAWRTAVDRHAILRTAFRWKGLDEPRQEVLPNVPVKLNLLDLRKLERVERYRRVEAWLGEDRRRDFELDSPPLMRLALFQTGAAEYQFVWTFHHLLLDARAVALLLNEVFTLTEAYRRGDDPELPAPRAFREHIEWLQRREKSKEELFWRRTLAGFKTPTPLVTSRNPAAANGEFDGGGEQETILAEMATARLRTVAKENRLTLNTLVQGAWAILLSRYSGEEDVVFGAVRACRRSGVEGAESIVGLFINTVPVRIRVPSDRFLLPWLADLRNVWVAMRDHEHTSLTDIQNWSEVPRGQGLFASFVSFQDPSWDDALRAQGGSWTNRMFSIRSQPNYPLALDASAGATLRLKLLYHRSHFRGATIMRMLGHLRTVLESMAMEPRQRLSGLPFLTEPERHRLLTSWNNTRTEIPRDKCVHELFEEQAARTPRALAVADEKEELTYDELNERGDRLARYLCSRGVGPDVCVGVCLERSAAMIVALLAVLKAGGAYVPLDPAYPKDRLAFMFGDAKMPVLLTREALCRDFTAGAPEVTLLSIDTLLDATSRTPRKAGSKTDSRKAKSSDLAYVIYTSGSTGTPKGVEIEHRSLVNLITWHQRTYRVLPADRATQLAAPAFDASVWEIWPYLTAGASIHIPDDETRLSPARLVTWLTNRQITLTFIPTPIAEAMLEERWPDECKLRAVLTGGDRLHRTPGPDFPCALVNHYGPTENTVVTTWVAVPPLPNKGDAPPIGRPVANAQVYVLDRQLRPVPVEVPGELYVGGAGLARGYHRRPELTAEKFIKHPFNNDPHARLYKTGDLVRWLPDGNLEFLGRADNQVKVRGWRIEPGEIETVLGGHPAVRETVVTAREQSPGVNVLAAYVIPAPGRKPSAEELRGFLKQKLPDQMIPGTFTLLDALPLTPNGKVDRAALPTPQPDSTSGFVGPRTENEERVAAIWRAVIGRERIGVFDDFFELGGDSLLATQVISRVQSGFQIRLSVRALFDHPTVASLVDAVGAAPRDAVAMEPAIQRRGARRQNGATPAVVARAVDAETVGRGRAAVVVNE